LSCHCEERSDEAISPHPAPLAPERPLGLLRSARNDKRGKTPSGCFAPLAKTKGGPHREDLIWGVLARAFFVCHCEECNDEAISPHPAPLAPETPSGCFAALAKTEGGVIARAFFVLSLRGAKRRSNLVSSPRPPQFASLRSQRRKGGVLVRGFLGLSSRGAFLSSVIARSAATKQSRLIPRRSPPRPPQVASLRSQRRKRASLRGPFLSCHCEERSDEAISSLPQGHLRLLRCARNDRRGRGPLRLLRFARKDEKGGDSLRLLRSARKDERGEGPPRLLRCARSDNLPFQARPPQSFGEGAPQWKTKRVLGPFVNRPP